MSSLESSVPQSLEDLRSSAMDMSGPVEGTYMHKEKHHHYNGFGPVGYGVLAFIVTLIILFLFRPQIVLSEDCECGELVFDWGKALAWSLGVGLVVLVIAYIANRGNNMHHHDRMY